MSKHTPGPWVEADGEIVHDAMTLARVYGADDFPCLDEDEDVQAVAAECKANALLMAAAPELHAALQALVDAVAQARRAEDNYLRSGEDAALWPAFEDAQATLIIRENAARAVLAALARGGEAE